MKTKTLFPILFFVAACGAADAPPTASCRPAVNVTIDAPKTKAPAAAAPQQQEVVQVYWDVSKSMRDFAAKRAPRNGAGGESDDLAAVVGTLDSAVLLQAHAERVEQYGIGEAIRPLANAGEALHPTANATVLHLVAEQIGRALADGTAQAALVVSDLELDTPPRSAANTKVCGDVPLPSNREAGTLFGRCFEKAALANPASRLRAHLVAHVFRKSSHGRELFILLLATDGAFGRRISDQIAQRLDFTRQVIFDADAIAASNVRGCTLATASDDVQLRSAGCSAKCFDRDASIEATCDVRRPLMNAWVQPAGTGGDGVAYETLKKKAGEAEEQSTVRFTIPCSAPPGRYQASVKFEWRGLSHVDAAFAQKASVRDLFDGLNQAIVNVARPRNLRIGIDLAK